jgi:hypothetical protein
MKQSLLLIFTFLFSVVAFAQSSTEPALIQPQELASLLKSGTAKPLILNVGPRMLYAQAHIPGAEYIGAASEPQAREALRDRVKSVPKTQAIVLYCGCCPWSHCPNVHPAYKELFELGYTDVKVLYIENNFGADWVDRGYPSERGR